MTATETTKTEIAPRLEMLGTFGRPLASRRALLVTAILVAAALAVVAALNWRGLVAAGVGSILLSVLPCLVMCGLGLCMHKVVGRTGAPSAREPSATDGTDVSIRAASGSLPGSAVGCCTGSGATVIDRATQSKEKTDA